MSDISRRKFLKASVVGVGVGVAVDGCSNEGEPPSTPGGPSGGARPPVSGSPTPPPPSTGTPPPTETPPPAPPTAPPPAGMGPPPGNMPPGAMGPTGMPLRALGQTGLMVSIVGFGSGSQYLGAPEPDGRPPDQPRGRARHQLLRHRHQLRRRTQPATARQIPRPDVPQPDRARQQGARPHRRGGQAAARPEPHQPQDRPDRHPALPRHRDPGSRSTGSWPRVVPTRLCNGPRNRGSSASSVSPVTPAAPCSSRRSGGSSPT